METSNGGESRIKDTRRNGESRGSVKNSQYGEKRENKNFERKGKSFDRNAKDGRRPNTERDSRDGNSKREFKQDGRQGGRGSFNRNGDNQSGFKGGNKPYKKNFGGSGYGAPYDKDKDEDVKVSQRPRQSQNKDNKAKEQQPDKSQVINRIEKEKKAMQKKQAERKNSRPARQMAKPKRTNNIDWTSVYENGEYDDDDLDMYY